jgi:hypothetical protein
MIPIESTNSVKRMRDWNDRSPHIRASGVRKSFRNHEGARVYSRMAWTIVELPSGQSITKRRVAWRWLM